MSRDLKVKDYSIAVTKHTILTSGQLALYGLLDEAYRKKFTITKAHIKTIYTSFVMRNPGMTYNAYKNRIENNGQVSYQGGYQPISDWQLNTQMLQWFTLSLGSLIKKGYLTAIPKFDLKDVKKAQIK